MGTTWSDLQSDNYDNQLWEQELVENALREISEDGARNYLGKNGDAVTKRIHFCLEQAIRLQQNGYWEPSVAVSVTAIELTIGFMLVRPLVHGAFLSDEWADILSVRIARGRSADDRELLPAILRRWGIDITTRFTQSGHPLWQAFKGKGMVLDKRNAFVHTASPLSEQDASVAIECAQAFMDVVQEIAQKLGFTLPVTGKWCQIGEEHTGTRFTPESPF